MRASKAHHHTVHDEIFVCPHPEARTQGRDARPLRCCMTGPSRNTQRTEQRGTLNPWQMAVATPAAQSQAMPHKTNLVSYAGQAGSTSVRMPGLSYHAGVLVSGKRQLPNSEHNRYTRLQSPERQAEQWEGSHLPTTLPASALPAALRWVDQTQHATHYFILFSL